VLSSDNHEVSKLAYDPIFCNRTERLTFKIASYEML
jgi:hypothetical protein